jgi:hypothetical protein
MTSENPEISSVALECLLVFVRDYPNMVDLSASFQHNQSFWEQLNTVLTTGCIVAKKCAVALTDSLLQNAGYASLSKPTFLDRFWHCML